MTRMAANESSIEVSSLFVIWPDQGISTGDKIPGPDKEVVEDSCPHGNV